MATVAKAWEHLRTEETRQVEDALRRKFHQADAYRFNSASIRVRVVDERFEGMPVAEREALVAPLLESLPEETQADIMILLTLAPSETHDHDQRGLVNLQFEKPGRSML